MTATVALHHRIDGRDQAPVVVLLHAIGTSLRMWEAQVAALSLEYRVVSADLRGHGASPVPAGPYTMGELAADVVALLDDLGIERASVCGLSLGGMVGLTMAAVAQDRVDRLVAACVVAVPPLPPAWQDRARRVRAGGTAAVSDLVVERWGYHDRAPEIGELVRGLLATTSAEGYAGCCEAIATMDLRPLLPLVSAPTLLLAGSDDPAAPASVAREMSAVMPDARVLVVDGAAHLLNVESATATTTAVLAHLGR